MDRRYSALLALSSLFGCASPDAQELPSSTLKTQPDALTVEAALQLAVDEAACVCEGLLAGGAVKEACGVDLACQWSAYLYRAENECADDPALKAYSDKYLEPTPGAVAERRFRCTASPEVGVSFRNNDDNPFSTRETNGCIDAVAVGVGIGANGGSGMQPGACGADFDYCLAQQLSMRADSFLRAPPPCQ